MPCEDCPPRTPLPGCARVWQTRIFFSVCLKGSRTDSAQVNFKAEEWRVDALFTSASSRLLQVAGISVMVVLHTLQLDRGNVSDDFSIFHILATTTLTMAVGGSTGVRYYMYFIVLCGGSTGVRYYMYIIVLCGGSTGVRYYVLYSTMWWQHRSTVLHVLYSTLWWQHRSTVLYVLYSTL